MRIAKSEKNKKLKIRKKKKKTSLRHMIGSPFFFCRKVKVMFHEIIFNAFCLFVYLQVGIYVFIANLISGFNSTSDEKRHSSNSMLIKMGSQ
jgi:hypothetical protein